MAAASDLFNPGFPNVAKDELDRRSKMPDSWKYKKYAYINLKLTGKSASNICVSDSSLVIGDSNVSNLYSYEAGVRKPKIILQSVNVVNQGNNGSYTDAYLYEIDASFKVYNKDTMDQVERGFFRLGAELEINFGWRGFSDDYNKGVILASIYNFGFSMESDGSYVCNVKAMSASSLFGHDPVAAEQTTKSANLSNTYTGDEISFVNLPEFFLYAARTAYGMKSDDKQPSAGLENNQVKYSRHMGYGFAALELETPSKGVLGYFEKKIDLGDTTVLYTTLGSIIDAINYNSIRNQGLFNINYLGKSQLENQLTPDELKGIGSSNPFRTFFFDGDKKAGYYGNPPGKTEQHIDFTIAVTPIQFSDNWEESYIGNIFINIDSIIEVYNTLQGNASSESGEKPSVKTSEFLSKLFGIIEEDTGGMVRLQMRPQVSNLDAESTSPTPIAPLQMEVINRALIPEKGETNSNPYKFSVLGQNSITRNVSLASDFDTGMLIRASQKSIKEGSSNMRGLGSLYPDCGNINAAVEINEANLVTMQHILDRKADIGENGWSIEKSNALSNLIKKYIMQNSHKIKKGSYGVIPMPLKLGVTIDGITGVPYMAPISIDRMPTAFKRDNIDFSITSIEHSFDGQGDWSTTYETVMRIK